MKHTNKLIGVTALTSISALAYYGVCKRGFEKVFRSKNRLEEMLAYLETEEMLTSIQWYNQMKTDEIWIKSEDDLNLHGIKIANYPKSNRWVIFVHGYSSNFYDMLEEAIQFEKEEYNILLIDHRGCGISDGKYTSMGYYESDDLCLWIEQIRCEHEDAKIVLYGESMGASACVLALGKLEENQVQCVIADSGYTSLKEILAFTLKKSYKVPFASIEPLFSQMIKSTLGFKMKDVDCLNVLKENMVPIMFVHGEEDSIVPFEMVFDNYYANRGVKELFTISGVGHCQGKSKSDYYQRVHRFIERFI
ncbi:MAG: alpha/beta hydrolase [Erysipelotrichaceae bacterium]